MTITAPTPSTNGYDDDRLARVYAVLAGIDPDDLRDALLAITEGAPLQRSTHDVDDPGAELPVGTGGAVELDDLPDFERVVGQNNQLPVHFLEEGVVVQRAVARVQLKEAFSGLPAGSGWGTGSLGLTLAVADEQPRHPRPRVRRQGRRAVQLPVRLRRLGADRRRLQPRP